MEKIKLAVIYYSSTGANQQISKWVAEAAETAGSEVRRRRIKETAPREAIESNPAWKKFVDQASDETEADLDDLDWADAIIWCIPTRYGSWPSQAAAFIDTTGGLWSQGKLVNKIVSATTSAMNRHGGQEGTIQTIYRTMMHWGAIIVSSGYTGKDVFAAGVNPYGTSAVVDGEGNIQDSEKVKAAAHHQTKRVLECTRQFISGQSRQ